MPRVYVGRLSYHIREKDIQSFFLWLLEVDLKNGYGFVEYDDTRDADDAVYELNGKDLCGERVIIEHARGPRRDRDGYGGGFSSSGYSSRSHTGWDKYGPPVRTEYRLIVDNLSSRCSWQDLKDFMCQAGEVTYADAHKKQPNEGVIEFLSRSDMRRALEKLDGTDINGRMIRLVEDKPRRRRSYSGSCSRSRSRRRFRSRSRRRRSSGSHSRSPSRSRSRSARRSRSRSNQKSHSRSGKKSLSKSLKSRSKSRSRSLTRKSRSRSHSHTHKSLSHSVSHKSSSRSDARKSRSKSQSKVKSERGSRSHSKEKSVSKKSQSRSPFPSENGNGERAKSASKSPSPQEDHYQSKYPTKHSASRPLSRFKSLSVRDP
ncbi:unnamed protein product, partial [Coregonus sp. 'balchen']